jgi:hypothetical protein
MGGVLIMSIWNQEYGASWDLQQLYPFGMKFRFVEVGSVEAENPPAHRYRSLAVRPPPISDHPVGNISGLTFPRCSAG